MENYTVLKKLGEGSFGVVLKARRVRDGRVVAIKRVHFKRGQESQHSALREFKSLQVCKHPCVVDLIEVFPSGAGISMVFEYMASDLGQVLASVPTFLTEPEVKNYMRQLLRGLAHLEALGVLHRDIKPANLLISPQTGALKIGDFGLARLAHPRGGSITQQVTTRWYRAPEILYGARRYTSSVDIWAAGCVFAELLNHSPIFPGDNDIDQLYRVLTALGTPTDKTWPGFDSLPDYGKISFPDMKGVPLRTLIPEASEPALRLVEKMLVLNPNGRISAREALEDPYFFSAPERCPTQRPVGRRDKIEPPVGNDLDAEFRFVI